MLTYEDAISIALFLFCSAGSLFISAQIWKMRLEKKRVEQECLLEGGQEILNILRRREKTSTEWFSLLDLLDSLGEEIYFDDFLTTRLTGLFVRLGHLEEKKGLYRFKT